VIVGIIEELRCITFRSEMCLGTIRDGQTCVGRESPWLARSRMFELDEQIVNVPGHAESAAPARIIPFDGDACQFVASHVELHTMEFIEELQEVVKMLNANVFDTKVIHNEAELKQTPFVVPETRRGSSFIEALGNEARSK
jgi:hypothetical protein